MSDDDFDITGPDGDPAATLASAYLDGDVTADERALVETDPVALDTVRRFGDVRTVLGATAPVASLSERENHLAGALDVWERMSDLERSGEATPAAGVDGAAAAALSTRRASRRRRDKRRAADGFGASQWFLSAAAVLVVVAGGVAIVRGILDDDATQSDVALDAPAEDVAPGVENLDELEAAEVNDENTNDDGILPESQIEDEAAAPGRAEDTGLFADDAMEEATESVAADADLPAEAEQPAPASEEDLTELFTLEDLTEFASFAIPAIGESPLNTSNTDLEPPEDSCEAQLDVEEIAGFALYQGVAVTVGVDLDEQIVIAYVDDAVDVGECEVVATTTLPDLDAVDEP